MGIALRLMSRGPCSPFCALPEDKIRGQCSGPSQRIWRPSQAFEHGDALLEFGAVIDVRKFCTGDRLTEEGAERLPALFGMKHQQSIVSKSRFYLRLVLFKHALRCRLVVQNVMALVITKLFQRQFMDSVPVRPNPAPITCRAMVSCLDA